MKAKLSECNYLITVKLPLVLDVKEPLTSKVYRKLKDPKGIELFSWNSNNF